MTIADVRAWNDLTPDERVQLEASVEEALIAQAQADLSNQNIDVRKARPTADVTLGAGMVANTWRRAGTGPGTLDPIVAWTLNDRQNAALYGFWDYERRITRITIANATTTLAVLEVSHIRAEENPGAYFRQIFLWKKNETMTVSAECVDAGQPVEVGLLIKIAEPAGQTFGCKV